jgi:translation initiation factor 1
MSLESSICKTCGLPSELCVCTDIAKEDSGSIRIYVERRKWGKFMTIISGLDPSSGLDLLKLTKKLKSKMATGGTFKEGNIELQGNHIYDVRDFLVKEGFDEAKIEVSSN